MPSSEVFSAPSTYVELQERYGSHVEKILIRVNQRYVPNFKALHGYVWRRLIEIQLLERFQEHLQRWEQMKFDASEVPPSHSKADHFKNYLTMAVLNQYANFCRTLHQRHTST